MRQTVRETALPKPSDRDRRGRFLTGNQAAVTHALHAEHVPDEFTSAAERFLAAALVDEGEEPPVRRRAQIENQARLFRRVLQLDAALERHGIFDRRGKLRVQWLTKLESI